MKKKQIVFYIAVLLTRSVLLSAQDIADARQLIENERYGSAEALLEKNLANGTAGPELSYLLVKTYLEQDKKEEAANYVSAYLQPDKGEKTDPLNRIAGARYLLNTGKKDEAFTIFNAILADRKNAKDAGLLLAMAEAVIDEDSSSVNKAVEWLEMARKREKHQAAIDNALGTAYRMLNDGNKAYLAFREAIKEEPANPRAYYLMGKLFVAQQNPQVYLDYFNKAYQLDSGYAPVLEELYHHYYFRDVRIARKYLEKFIASTDHRLQNDYNLADILFLTGDYDKAIRTANGILSAEQERTKPRLYKLIAYSYARSGDSSHARVYMEQYMNKEEDTRKIGADYRFLGDLTAGIPGSETNAIAYYTAAAKKDTSEARKAAAAKSIAALWDKLDNKEQAATWLGNYYRWKENPTNVDLFNWGLAWYKAGNYQLTDSVFSLYTTKYPEDIYGYYWRAQAGAAIDTAMTDSLAIPHYRKVMELGEKNKDANKRMLLKAYGYLGGYEANITKDYAASLALFEKYNAIEENEEVSRYIETLRRWIGDKNK